ncbi:importin beta-2 subunit [Pseudohyphozyma bogoriensis]|nr:importin beta-2 subunit [Pseudohyphozyma bogoriensis]
MWHAYNLIQEGDELRGSAVRRVQTESSTGSTSSHRVHLKLTIIVTKVLYSALASAEPSTTNPSSSTAPPEELTLGPSTNVGAAGAGGTATLHVSGKVSSENPHVKKGAFHTLDLEVGRDFTIIKQAGEWDSVARERIKEITEVARGADVGAVVCGEGMANICIITNHTTIIRQRIEVQVPRKRKGGGTALGADKANNKFLDQVYAAIVRHFDFDTLKVLIIASPGFTKEAVFQHVMDQAVKQGNKSITSARSKFLLLHSPSHHVHSLAQILASPEVTSQLKDTKFAREGIMLDKFNKMLDADPLRAWYGEQHVLKAAERAAVSKLLISDEIFRSPIVSRRKKFVKLVEDVKGYGGEVLIFSSMHESGQPCLRNSSASDTAIQQQVQERLESFNRIPDYNSYLTYVLTQLPAEDATVRSMAGLLLKNNIRMRLESFSPDVVAYVKQHIFAAIADQVPMIRNTVSTVIATLMYGLGPENWPEALSKLMELVDSPDLSAQEGSFATLVKICQDMPKKLDLMEVSGQRPLQFMLPKFLQYIDSPHAKIRVHALSCTHQFISPDVNALTPYLENFMVSLFKHASDDSSDVRKLVCQSLVQLLATRPDILIPHLANVVDFMLFSTQDKDDEEVALEACEFWLTFAEDPELVDHLRPFLPKVIPVLLDSMVYSEDDILILDTDEDDAAVPDKASDIKPHLLQSKMHTNERIEDPENPNNPAGGKSRGAEDDDEEEDSDEEYDEDEDETYTEWNLRKCSAAALDVIAVAFEGEMMDVLLPFLKVKLFSQDWLDRESAILALGAIAEGCITPIEQHLPVLMGILINSLSDPKPLVRSITCWTIGRYSSWTIKVDATLEHKQQYFVPAMEGLLKMCLDNNKRVQEAGCSAFATLEEEAGAELEPFLGSILGNLVFAFNKYQQKNLLILYDAIGTLADAVSSALNQEGYINTLMPPLIQRWGHLDDADPDLIPLLECLSSVVIAVGQGFVPYAQPVFERCVRIVRQALVEFQTFSSNPAQYDEPDKTFLIVSLDLLSGLTQGLNSSITQLYASSDPPVLTLLAMCLQHPDPGVRQSSYALLGDTAISCFPILKPSLSQFMPGLIGHIDVNPAPAEVSVCNNAAWAAGEIALQAGPEMEQWVQPLMERIVPVLLSSKAARSLTENSAVTIGRLAIVCPQIVAPHLQVFVSAWCQALADIKDNEEKDSAFRGICAAIQVNPNGVATSFGFFLNAVARWTRPSPALHDMFKTILVAFKDNLEPAAWDAQLNLLPPIIASRLRERYPI